jgi:hypothetical protein
MFSADESMVFDFAIFRVRSIIVFCGMVHINEVYREVTNVY